MARPTLREKVGSEIAYKIDWYAMGFTTVMRCGGTIVLTDKKGVEITISVFDEDNPRTRSSRG